MVAGVAEVVVAVTLVAALMSLVMMKAFAKNAPGQESPVRKRGSAEASTRIELVQLFCL